jgi:hypothetical protein
MTEAETRVKFAMYSDIIPRVRGGIIGHVATIEEEMTAQMTKNPEISSLETRLIH